MPRLIWFLIVCMDAFSVMIVSLFVISSMWLPFLFSFVCLFRMIHMQSMWFGECVGTAMMRCLMLTGMGVFWM